ncbi:MAG: Do family serine endopeptidase [Muribaculaceae bacterium]|nr:Do family serine endopeptidase [Muribaculaceae bacterium]
MKNSAKSAFLVITAAICGLTTTACANANSDKTIEDTLISSVADSGKTDNFFTVAAPSTAPTDFTYAAEQTINGVVSIKSFATPRAYRYGGSDAFSDPFFDFFFGNPNRRRQQQPRQQGEEAQQQLGLGSGVIINSDGYIVTNNHVIEGAERLEITLNDNRTFNATVIGSDATTDLALIKIDAEDLPVIPIGDSDALRVGEWVLAVGNPFGFTSTVTAGIVSAKARSISSVTHGRQMGIESFIQTDAAVNPGNSGGALVNTKGELVGINTAIYSQTGNYAGYSFAIPTSIVTKIISDLKQFGAVQRAVLGIAYSELTPKIAKEKNITIVNAGLYIGRIEERSAAMEAGLQEGDVVIAINGVETLNSGQLQEQMSKYRPGDKITITYVRDNKKHTAKVTLRNNQGNTNITKAKNMMDLGCAFKAVPEETLRQLEIRNGVQVSGLKDGKFKEAGIKDGFIILEINNARVTSQEDVEKIYNEIMKSDASDKVMFITGIYPTGKKLYYAVPLTD